jgi:hypothetical protein
MVLSCRCFFAGLVAAFSVAMNQLSLMVIASEKTLWSEQILTVNHLMAIPLRLLSLIGRNQVGIQHTGNTAWQSAHYGGMMRYPPPISHPFHVPPSTLITLRIASI